MRVALTIDTEERSRPAGRDNARRQLDLLRRGGVRATSFVQGRWAQANPELARRIADDGHLVGNHTYHHVPLSLMTDEGIRHTVTRAEEVIGRAPAWPRHAVVSLPVRRRRGTTNACSPCSPGSAIATSAGTSTRSIGSPAVPPPRS